MLKQTLIAAFFAAISLPAAMAADTTAAPQRPAAKPTQAKDRIYGSQLMTPEERDGYRAMMRSAKTQAERDALRQQHHADMQQRAKERGVTLPDTTPGAPARARPRGPAPGQGMGPGGGPGKGY